MFLCKNQQHSQPLYIKFLLKKNFLIFSCFKIFIEIFFINNILLFI